LRRFLIVGIDPGATIGIAMLGLSGQKIATGSILGGGIGEATRFIEQHGTPSLIACDVNPAPDMALRLASFFSCKLHLPEKEIREEEKRRAASIAGVANNHERDAYCAALFAYRAHANKFRQIDSLEELPLPDKEKVKHLMLKGYRLKDAFLELGESVSAPIQPEQARKQERAQSPFSPEALKSRISELARENAHLRMLAERLESENRALEGKIRLLENGVRQAMLRDSEFRKLRFQLGLALGKLDARLGRHKNKPARKGNLQPVDVHHAKFSMPAKSVAPVNLAMPVKPATPAKSAAPAAPVTPAAPAKPAAHAKFVAPAPSANLSAPAAPVTPAAPAKPAASANSPQQFPRLKTPAQSPESKPREAGLYNLGEGNLDLDKLVAEYRKGKK